MENPIHYAIKNPDGEWERLCWSNPMVGGKVPENTLTVLHNWLTLPFRKRCKDCYEWWLACVRYNQEQERDI